MAKFAQVGYGSDGRAAGKSGVGYTYVVNDNVRTGDVLRPVVNHYLSGKAFATTGVVLSRSQNLQTEKTIKQQLVNQEVKTQLSAKGYLKVDKEGRVVDVQSAKSGETGLKEIYTGKQLGVKGLEATRGGNLAMYKETHPDTKLTQNAQETFDSYSKQFMKKGEN